MLFYKILTQHTITVGTPTSIKIMSGNIKLQLKYYISYVCFKCFMFEIIIACTAPIACRLFHDRCSGRMRLPVY